MDKMEFHERLDGVRATIGSVNASIESLNERHSGFLGQLHPERTVVAGRGLRDLGGCAVELVKLIGHVPKVIGEDRG